MADSVSVYVGGNLSAIFEPLPCGGVKGVGMPILEGVKTSFTPGDKTEIRINGVACEAQTSRNVLKTYGVSGLVSHDLDVPGGQGFGSSGAGSLGLSIAVNKTINSRLDETSVVRVAHDADINAHTGLGDVASIVTGSVVLGTVEREVSLSLWDGSKANLTSIMDVPDKVVVGWFPGELSTRDVLSDPLKLESIVKCGRNCLDLLAIDPIYENLIVQSRIFARETHLASPKVLSAMDVVSDCSMVMLGNSVFCFRDEGDEQDAVGVFRSLGANVGVYTVRNKPGKSYYKFV